MPTIRSPLDQALRLPGVWRARDVALAEAPGVPTGWFDLDGRLPGGGWPRGALTELHVPALGVGELSLLAPALAWLSNESRWLAFVDPPELPYAPALAQRGIALDRVLVLRTRNARDARWSMEQLVRSGAASAVLAWLPDGDERALRRMHAAAAGGPTFAVCCLAPSCAPRTSPAALRIALRGLGRRRIELDVLKRRGSRLAPFAIDLAAAIDGRTFVQPLWQPVARPVKAATGETGPAEEGLDGIRLDAIGPDAIGPDEIRPDEKGPDEKRPDEIGRDLAQQTQRVSWDRPLRQGSGQASGRDIRLPASPALPDLPANVARFMPRPAGECKPIAVKPKPKPKQAARVPRLVPRDDDPQYQLL